MTRTLFAVFSVFALLVVLPVQAQDSAVSGAAPSDVLRTFTPADFAQFAPRTALDMLNRVPGFAIRAEDNERGLGQASGNVLINGQRISGKSNDVITELSRIPAQNVERIDIVDGATLEIPGLSGQVANVIVASTGINGQFSYRPEFRAYATDPLFTRFEVSLGGKRGAVEYTVGLSNPGSRSGATGPTWIYSPAGELIEERDDEWKGNAEQPRLSARLVFDGPGESIGNLNLLYGRLYFDYLEEGTRVSPGEPVRSREVTVEEGGDNYELAGDYEFDLGVGRMKTIGIARGRRTPGETEVITRLADGTFVSGIRVDEENRDRELIGRTEYSWGGAASSEWQVSGEAAFNTLSGAADLFTINGDGTYTQIPFPGGTARVEEDRYEVMGTYGRPLSSTVEVKLSAGGEYSQISQVGAGGTTRSFYRPKGELTAAWKASPSTDVNVKLARTVGQLNFYDFIASIDVADDIEDAANPDLVPQQSWNLDVEGVRRLGDHGTTTLRLFGKWIDDIIDYVPIGATGEAPGNLDHAIVYGIESNSTFNLDRIGFRQARLDLELVWQDSEVEDPLTGEKRPISNSLLEASSFALRHDVPNTDWAWGAGASYQLAARSYRLTEVGRLWEGPVWGDIYLEHKDVYGLTVRAGIYNLFGADSMWDRTVYVGRRTGPVQYIEERDRTIGPIFSFAIRGKF